MYPHLGWLSRSRALHDGCMCVLSAKSINFNSRPLKYDCGWLLGLASHSGILFASLLLCERATRASYRKRNFNRCFGFEEEEILKRLF